MEDKIDKSIEVRKKILKIIHNSNASHAGSCLSMVEILSAIYESVDLDKIKRKEEDRDRIIVSKGHSAAALYSTLWYYGILKDEEIESYHKNNSLLAGHVTRNVFGVEHSTGALGHGLSVGAGMAYGFKSKQIKGRVYVVVGDGELQEGSNWEAMQFASHYKLDNLCLMVDYNKLSGIGETNSCCSMEPLKERLESFGFVTFEVNGHDKEEIKKIIQKTNNTNKPIAIICHTIKGKGVSFMENSNIWHYRSINQEDYKKAILEVRGK
jgi:transketolase